MDAEPLPLIMPLYSPTEQAMEGQETCPHRALEVDYMVTIKVLIPSLPLKTIHKFPCKEDLSVVIT